MTFDRDPVLAGLAELSARQPVADSASHASTMSRRYRQMDKGLLPLDRSAPNASPEQVVAYAVSRMPATYAAAQAASKALAAARPGFAPRTVLDVGGGLGAAGYAAAMTWPSVQAITVVDGDRVALALGRDLNRSIVAMGSLVPEVSWREEDLAHPSAAEALAGDADLVTIGYVLSELTEPARRRLVESAARVGRGEGAVVVIEPGTPDGYRRVLAARQVLLDAGCEVAAPCPHGAECPLASTDDWCHFSTRLARSSAHRAAKAGRLGYEDEKFSYVAATHPATARPGSSGDPPARIVRHPTWRKSLVELRLCLPDPPRVANVRIPRSSGPLAYRAARAAAWGDTWPDQPRSPVDEQPVR